MVVDHSEFKAELVLSARSCTAYVPAPRSLKLKDLALPDPITNQPVPVLGGVAGLPLILSSYPPVAKALCVHCNMPAGVMLITGAESTTLVNTSAVVKPE